MERSCRRSLRSRLPPRRRRSMRLRRPSGPTTTTRRTPRCRPAATTAPTPRSSAQGDDRPVPIPRTTAKTGPGRSRACTGQGSAAAIRRGATRDPPRRRSRPRSLAPRRVDAGRGGQRRPQNRRGHHLWEGAITHLPYHPRRNVRAVEAGRHNRDARNAGGLGRRERHDGRRDHPPPVDD